MVVVSVATMTMTMMMMGKGGGGGLSTHLNLLCSVKKELHLAICVKS